MTNGNRLSQGVRDIKIEDLVDVQSDYLIGRFHVKTRIARPGKEKALPCKVCHPSGIIGAQGCSCSDICHLYCC